MKVTHSDSVLTINGREFAFEQRIQQVLVLADRVIVRFRGKSFADDDPLKGRNIIALDENGEMLWRIQDRGVTRTTKDGKGRRSKAQKLKDKEVEKEGTPVDVVRESDVKGGGGNG